MLRLNVYCSIIPSATQVKLGSCHGSCIIKYHKARKSSWGVSVRALKDETDGGTNSSGSAGSSWDPGLEIEVPFEQRPVNEYSSLKDGVLYSWGELGPGQFFLRLGGVWLVAFAVLGVPISAASFDPALAQLMDHFATKRIQHSKQLPAEQFFQSITVTKENPLNVPVQLPVEVMADDDLAAAAAEAADGRPVYINFLPRPMNCQKKFSLLSLEVFTLFSPP